MFSRRSSGCCGFRPAFRPWQRAAEGYRRSERSRASDPGSGVEWGRAYSRSLFASLEGQRVVTAVTLVGSPFIPFGNAQVIEVHPKLS